MDNIRRIAATMSPRRKFTASPSNAYAQPGSPKHRALQQSRQVCILYSRHCSNVYHFLQYVFVHQSLLITVCDSFLSFTCNSRKNSTKPVDASKAPEVQQSAFKAMYSVADCMFWMGLVSRLQCQFAHQRALEPTTATFSGPRSPSLPTATTASMTGLEGQTDLAIMLKVHNDKFGDQTAPYANRPICTAALAWQVYDKQYLVLHQVLN